MIICYHEVLNAGARCNDPLGKPSGGKICLRLDFFRTTLTPPAPCIFGTLRGTFLKLKFLNVFGFRSSSPIFLGKCLAQSRKKYLFIFGIRQPPSPLSEKCPNSSKKVPQKFWNKVTNVYHLSYVMCHTSHVTIFSYINSISCIMNFLLYFFYYLLRSLVKGLL